MYNFFMFKYAIVKKPGNNFSDGVSTYNLGKPNYEKALQQHNGYCKALKKCGLELIMLKPDIQFPDGVFIEDTAVVTEKCAIITRLGAATRHGEENKTRETLSSFRRIENIESGTVDGGDILRIKDHFYIGLSKRTNEEGAKQLGSVLSRYGYTSSTILVKNVLHLKTGITYIGNNNLVSIDESADKQEFKEFKIIRVDNDESYSANCLFVNDFLLMPKNFPKTKEKIQALGYKILEIEMSEFQKMDGGLTCLSILF